MKKYRITSYIESASGWQQWEVKAESKEQAKQFFHDGGGEFISEEIEAQSITNYVEDEEVIDELVVKKEVWPDSNVQAVIEMMKKRMEFGLNKYGVTTERTDIDLLGWVQHLQEELCDAAVYVERLKKELESKK